jgi:hypothetical protein
MKVSIDIDCTPEEARTFLGLPDVAPLQQAMLKEMEERMRGALGAMDPDAMVKLWLPVGMEGWEQMQKLFWSQLGGAAKPGERKPK